MVSFRVFALQSLPTTKLTFGMNGLDHFDSAGAAAVCTLAGSVKSTSRLLFTCIGVRVINIKTITATFELSRVQSVSPASRLPVAEERVAGPTPMLKGPSRFFLLFFVIFIMMALS